MLWRMKKSASPKEFSFTLVHPQDMPELVRASWEPTLNLVQDVIDRYHIKMRQVKLHYHKNPRKVWGKNHPYGHSIYSHREIVLCAQDFDTALHEVAHVWSKNPHTDKWARCYFHLIEKYLTPEEFKLKLKKAKKAYKPCARMAHLFEFEEEDDD
jgi:hypothetical protein